MKISKILTAFTTLTISQIYSWRPKFNLDKSKVVYALNCGSSSKFTSKDGFEYEAVNAFFF